VLFAARMAAWKTSEVALTRLLLDRLEPGMLCLADRLFYGYSLWRQAAETGAQLLWRVQKKIPLPRLRMLGDRSYLSEVGPRSNAPKAERGPRLQVRVIEFDVTVGIKREHYRVITTLLDPKEAPALELASLYARRWGIETAFSELKTYLRGRGVLLRSQLPDLVEQDFYGLLLAHFGVRSVMEEAARKNELEPTELSFVPFPPSAGNHRCHRRIVNELGEERIPERPHRHYPRAVRKRPYRYGPLTDAKRRHICCTPALVKIALS